MTIRITPGGHKTAATFCRHEKRERDAITGKRFFVVVNNCGRVLFQGTADEVAARWSSAVAGEDTVVAPPESAAESAPLATPREEAAS